MATLEGEGTVDPSAQAGLDGNLLLPVLLGENTTYTAGSAGSSTTPRVSVDSRSGIVRRSVR